MPERMPFDDLSEFEAAAHHPMSLSGKTTEGIIRLARQLKGYRQATGLTQGQVGERLGWSVSKVQRMESSASRTSMSDVMTLLRLYGVPEEAIHSAAAAVQAIPKVRRNPEYARRLSNTYVRYLEMEAAATEVAVYAPGWVPNFLSTSKYAQAIARVFHPDQTEADQALHAKLSRERAAYLVGRSGPILRIIIDASVFLRPTDSEDQPEHTYNEVTAIMRGLERLNAAGRSGASAGQLNPRATVQIAPTTLDAIANEGGLTFATLSLDGQPMAAYVDSHADTLLMGDVNEIEEYRASFDRLSGRIPGPEETASVLNAIYRTIAAQ